MKDQSLDFSFSGIKTAVRRQAQLQGLERAADEGDESSPEVLDMVASFQKAVVDVLVRRTIRACRQEQVKNVVVTGGVACNTRLRRAFAEIAPRENLRIYFPSPQYTTDNAAMIAAAGFLHLERNHIAPQHLPATATLPL
jgi:N6-L-threonylcarbamoyladenine synthase